MRRRVFITAVAVCSFVAQGVGSVVAGEALVAVAANFSEPAARIAAVFERSSGHKIRLTTGATGKLYAQIVAGAPFDVLLSADAATPERLEREGFGAAGQRKTYAIGRLALWSADPKRIGADPRAALIDPGLRHVAIANPDLAPYGVAARETLIKLDLWPRVQPRLVMGENIGQSFVMTSSGAAELGFVALSAVIAPGKAQRGSLWRVPAEMHAPIRQDGLVTRSGAGNDAAVAFFAFLSSPAARDIIIAYDYGSE